MNKTLGFRLAVYGVLLAGLGYLTHYLAPEFARPTLITGSAGGALCVVWGLRAVLGQRGKALPILTLIPITFVMMSQTVLGWMRGQAVPAERVAVLVITVIFLCSIGMLMMVAYAGVTLDGRPASPAQKPGPQSQAPGNAGGATSKVGKRA